MDFLRDLSLKAIIGSKHTILYSIKELILTVKFDNFNYMYGQSEANFGKH